MWGFVFGGVLFELVRTLASRRFGVSYGDTSTGLCFTWLYYAYFFGGRGVCKRKFHSCATLGLDLRRSERIGVLVLLDTESWSAGVALNLAAIEAMQPSRCRVRAGVQREPAHFSNQHGAMTRADACCGWACGSNDQFGCNVLVVLVSSRNLTVKVSELL